MNKLKVLTNLLGLFLYFYFMTIEQIHNNFLNCTGVCTDTRKIFSHKSNIAYPFIDKLKNIWNVLFSFQEWNSTSHEWSLRTCNKSWVRILGDRWAFTWTLLCSKILSWNWTMLQRLVLSYYSFISELKAFNMIWKQPRIKTKGSTFLQRLKEKNYLE